MIITEYIKKEKFSQFYGILCATGGRYLRNPEPLFSSVAVYYEPGDYKTQCEMWVRCNVAIKEVNTTQWWRILVRRLKNFNWK